MKSRTHVGRPRKQEWRRALSTGNPALTYTYYVDISIICKERQVSPETILQPDDTFTATQTLFLGTFTHAAFIANQTTIIDDKLAEWAEEHPACRVTEVGVPYRHWRGS